MAGLCHQSGQAGAALDRDEAIRYFRLVYETGNGVETDPGQARLLHERAAQQGHRDAQFKLGLRASRGPILAELGIEPAPQVKRRWWKLH